MLILMFLTQALFADAVCESAAMQARSFCDKAMMSTNTSASGNANSIGQGAAQLTTAADADQARMRDAIKYCDARMKQCQEQCSRESANGDMSPNVLKQCSDAIAGGRLPKEANCISPLVVQLGTEPLRMTAPRDGVLFDIKGANARPVPYAPVAISWLDPKSRADNYFLALPNERGEILGIDQLFGNNTLGPWKAAPFAPNGFEALRKHDDNHDGVIDRADPVFSRLRLWHDLNGDGAAQKGELVSLADAKVESVDLAAAYNPDYFEEDVHGNSIRGKSVVTMRDQSLRLLFDVWFVERDQ